MKTTLILGLVGAVLGLTVLPAGAVVVGPGPDVQERLQEALILAKPGDTIELEAGVSPLKMGLSLDVDNVTLKGAGHDKSILSFKGQNAGSEGLIVTSSGVTLQDFAVEDSLGDGIKVKGANGITFRGVRAAWTGGPKPTNGAYGFYPVESKDVLVDGCIAEGASDAGIYVGQCQRIIVRNSIARFNVAGIEIENCYYADVYNNLAEHNTGGILVFDLPNLPQQGGHDVRVFNNKCINNDTVNFAPEGNIVGFVPTGTGLSIMANENVEVFGNVFDGNGTTNISIRGYMPYGEEKVDANYYPYPRNLHIHDNQFGTGGFKPMGVRGELYAKAAGSATLPDIMWDGQIDVAKVKSGERPANANIFIVNNGDADFINLDLPAYLKDPKSSKPSRDLGAHKGSLPALKPVTLPQDGQVQTD
jgi:parallel beta-helix repeat protein